MTNNSYTCPVGVKVVITISGLSTTIKIGKQGGRCKTTVEGETEKEVEGEEEPIKVEFKITFYFQKKGSFDPEKCFLKGNASFVGKATIKKIGKEPYDISLNEEIDFDTSEGRDGEPYCKNKEFTKKHKVTFNNYAHAILVALKIRKITIKGKLTVNVSCFQKTNPGKYLGNKSSGHMEIHDLKNIKKGCKIDEILEKHKVYFNSIKEGLDKGFNGCFYCLHKYHTE